MSATARVGRWKPGQSGNPRGRPARNGEPGSAAKLRAAIAEHVPNIIDRLVEQAKGGDVGACRLLLERALPALKPVETVVPVTIEGQTLTDQGRSVLGAIGKGELAPGQAAHLLTGLGVLAKLTETDELARRVAALEKAHGQH